MSVCFDADCFHASSRRERSYKPLQQDDYNDRELHSPYLYEQKKLYSLSILIATSIHTNSKKNDIFTRDERH